MARCRSSNVRVDDLTEPLSSLADFIAGITRLRTLLLQSSPSYLVSQPEELISLIEVAKNTLIMSGVRLHTFSSCPDRLRPFKAAYFGLLSQLQAHSHNTRLETKDLQARLSRLLFPLTTQLKLYSDASDDTDIISGPSHNLVRVSNSWCGSQALPEAPRPNSGPNGWAYSSPPLSTPHLKVNRVPLPPNVMLPPALPLRRETQDNLSLSVGELDEDQPWPISTARAYTRPRRHISRDTVHFKHRNPEAGLTISPPTMSSLHLDVEPEADNPFTMEVEEDEEDASGSDEEPPVASVVIPARSPLRRSFGIFCTGKGRGAFSGGGGIYQHRSGERDHGTSRGELLRA